MSITLNQPLPSTARLLRATLLAAGVAAVLLVTVVMPAEYNIDPLGTGRLLGLTKLSVSSTEAETAASPAPLMPAAPGDHSEANILLAQKAKTAFGENKGQTLDAAATALTNGDLRRDTLSVTLPPGKGAEIKAHLKQGAGVVYRWKASGDVAVDMHGERPDVKGAWTSYSVEAAQRQAEGTFIAPFDGTHGWYWQNRTAQPVDVAVEVVGFQADLYRP
ncbi:hypothetical protein [Xanthomonas oryzae]|uniref:hypothetical protein n=1 Tax=Xanthomonas oryzae TaxID=347 RepID=UPI0006A668CC|nr:hypothetical protein [Xanthomonas oryzae]AKJ75455.1 putative transmembrane anchor protein [Xanthomonas oryzae pv. oryzicola]UBB91441.1 hypothetical protein K2I41_00190 [Xanthomonas oryzae pv. oryzicola]UBB91501.1 hypothetical protein K2I41_11170 [Xanthomonas oryzae pv. oryzicola]